MSETPVLVPTLETGTPIAAYTDSAGELHQSIVISDAGPTIIAAVVKAANTPPTLSDAALEVTTRPDSVSNDGGTAISGQVIPTGGIGLTGWLSACYKVLGQIFTQLSSSVAVTGTFWQSTQPVSIAQALNITGGNKPVGPANIATIQSTVGQSIVLIVGQRSGSVGTGRCSVTLKNTGSAAVFLGGPGVGVGTGFQLSPGDIDSFDTTSAIFGISSANGNVVCVMETF